MQGQKDEMELGPGCQGLWGGRKKGETWCWGWNKGLAACKACVVSSCVSSPTPQNFGAKVHTFRYTLSTTGLWVASKKFKFKEFNGLTSMNLAYIPIPLKSKLYF